MAAATSKNVLLGVTGSVATVKYAKLALALSEFATVRVVVTAKSTCFTGAVSEDYDADSLASFAKSGMSVLSDEDEWNTYTSVHESAVLHIELQKWADVVVVAPCSANTLAKLAGGLADNLLTCVCRVYDPSTPTVLAPAMNTKMWEHPVTTEHLSKLESWGHTIVPPVAKKLACGDIGVGAMASVETVVAAVRERLDTKSEGKLMKGHTPSD